MNIEIIYLYDNGNVKYNPNNRIQTRYQTNHYPNLYANTSEGIYNNMIVTHYYK